MTKPARSPWWTLGAFAWLALCLSLGGSFWLAGQLQGVDVAFFSPVDPPTEQELERGFWTSLGGTLLVLAGPGVILWFTRTRVWLRITLIVGVFCGALILWDFWTTFIEPTASQ